MKIAPDTNYSEMRDVLKFAVKYYPNFLNWFNMIERNKRPIYSIVDDGEYVGIVILKKTLFEDKICAIWVNPKYRKNNIATMLIEFSITELDNKKPSLSIPKALKNDFSKLILKFDWSITSYSNGNYYIN